MFRSHLLQQLVSNARNNNQSRTTPPLALIGWLDDQDKKSVQVQQQRNQQQHQQQKQQQQKQNQEQQHQHHYSNISSIRSNSSSPIKTPPQSTSDNSVEVASKTPAVAAAAATSESKITTSKTIIPLLSQTKIRTRQETTSPLRQVGLVVPTIVQHQQQQQQHQSSSTTTTEVATIQRQFVSSLIISESESASASASASTVPTSQPIGKTTAAAATTSTATYNDVDHDIDSNENNRNKPNRNTSHNNQQQQSDISIQFQNMIQSRRTAGHFSSIPPLSSSSLHGTNLNSISSTNSMNDTNYKYKDYWLQVIHRAVYCGITAPNHKRTEPFSFRSIVAPSKIHTELCNIVYNTTLYKFSNNKKKNNISTTNVQQQQTTSSDDDNNEAMIVQKAQRKRQRWANVPAFLVTIVHSDSTSKKIIPPLAPTPSLDHNTTTTTTSFDDSNNINMDNDSLYKPIPFQPIITERELEDYASACVAVQNCLLSIHSESSSSSFVVPSNNHNNNSYSDSNHMPVQLQTKWATGSVIQTPAFRQLIHAQQNDRIVALIMIGFNNNNNYNNDISTNDINDKEDKDDTKILQQQPDNEFDEKDHQNYSFGLQRTTKQQQQQQNSNNTNSTTTTTTKPLPIRKMKRQLHGDIVIDL